MNALLVVLLAGALASWLASAFACVRFGLTYRRWQKVTGRGLSVSDPARNFEYVFRFFGSFGLAPDDEAHAEAPRLRAAGRRFARLAGLAGALFGAFVVLALFATEVA